MLNEIVYLNKCKLSVFSGTLLSFKQWMCKEWSDFFAECEK